MSGDRTRQLSQDDACCLLVSLTIACTINSLVGDLIKKAVLESGTILASNLFSTGNPKLINTPLSLFVIRGFTF